MCILSSCWGWPLPALHSWMRLAGWISVVRRHRLEILIFFFRLKSVGIWRFLHPHSPESVFPYSVSIWAQGIGMETNLLVPYEILNKDVVEGERNVLCNHNWENEPTHKDKSSKNISYMKIPFVLLSMKWIGKCGCKPKFGGKDWGELNCASKESTENFNFLELI